MSEKLPYQDESLSFSRRAEDLVSRMTLEEKVSQMLFQSPAIERLGIPAYNWWNECLHGVARAGVATMFPQAIGMAATFDEKLFFQVGDIISTEARAKYHEFQRKGDRDIYKGLTMWSPNVNIFRDPRWGRGQETYGEDPFLTGKLGIAFVKGLQGNDPRYLKAAACAKHFAVHSGPESERHSFNAVVSAKDLRETYLPAFRDLVKEAGVEGVMGAYNRTNGEPCCGSKTLLTDILRREWGFKGYVTSDCWAIKDFHVNHMVTKSAPESAALAVNNGCDTNCGSMFANLLIAHEQGFVNESAIDRAVTTLMTTRMKLGMFDCPEHVPYTRIPYEKNDCEEHRKAAREVSRRSLVLLKNEGGLLPLERNAVRSIAVIGPNADSRAALVGNYMGTASHYVTVLEGIREAVAPGTRIYYAQGCHLCKDRVERLAQAGDRIAEAVSAAEHADVAVVCLGLDASIEGEQGDTGNAFAGGDKKDLSLPGEQEKLLEAVYATGKPVVLILLSGSAFSISWADVHVPAIVEAWYPGAEGGAAVASLLFGDFSPAGKLPVTFYRSTEELPDFHDYSMEGRTYRYMKNEALYPFGYGLSYTRFAYEGLTLSAERIRAGQSVRCGVTVRNAGRCEGDEIVELYLRDIVASVTVPRWELRGVEAVRLKPGEAREVRFELTPRLMSLIDNDGRRVLEPGTFEVYVGGSQPDSRSCRLTGTDVLSARFEVEGDAMEMEY